MSVIKLWNRGTTSWLGYFLQGGFYDNFNEKSGFSPERDNCGGHVWQRVDGSRC